MIEKTAVFARYLLQPTESLDNGLAVEALVFPAYPIGKHHVQVVHDLDKFCLAELVIVIVPTSDLALNLYPTCWSFQSRCECSFHSFIFSCSFFTDFLLMAGRKLVKH